MYFMAFLNLSAICIAWAIVSDDMWLKVLLLYSAVSFAFAGIAYLVHRPTLMMKRSTGRVGLPAWLVYGAFFLLNGFLFHLHRLTSGEHKYDEIVPGLYLGRMLTNREAKRLTPQPIAVLDAVCEFSEPATFRKSGGYLLLPVLDGTAPSQEQLCKGVDHIIKYLKQGPVYVHCAVGHGRSATFVAAYLLAAKLADDIPDAIRFIRNNRKRIGLKPSQVRELGIFAESLNKV